MKFKTALINDFNNTVDNREIICFCASNHFKNVISKNGCALWMDKISFFVDNNYEKTGTFELADFGKKWDVKNPSVLKEYAGNYVILILSAVPGVIREIIGQLIEMKLPQNIDCYCLLQMEEDSEQTYDNSELKKYVPNGTERINKIIHCCWFSGEEKPQKYIDCINSWKENCPDYEIIEWNSDNYDFTKNAYMYEAYKKRKWAFVSDYARLDLVYNYGGIYLDMDVEIVKSLDDLLNYECFLAEDNNGLIDFGSGFGAVKGNALIGKLLRAYDNFEFRCSGDKIDFSETIPQPQLLLPLLTENGYVRETKTQILDGCVCLSPDYFKVMDDPEHFSRQLNGTEYALHWHHGGWVDKEYIDAKSRRVKEKIEFLNYYKDILIN